MTINVCYCSAATSRVHQRGALDPKLGENPRATFSGERMLVLSDGVYDAWLQQWKGSGDRDPIQEYVSAQLGMPIPTDDNYAVIVNGIVANIIMQADPALGHLDDAQTLARSMQGVQIVPSGHFAAVVLGAIYDGTKFINPVQPVIQKSVSQIGTGT